LIICIADQENWGEEGMSSPVKIQHAFGMPEKFGLQIVQVDSRMQNPTRTVLSCTMLAALEW